ncbi:GNAT family N-acetyltransferase [Microbacterium sp. STN6]|uniref:GNAT family N-acetyltransferase n=1 Tax=Microbacterium sp. STN6 TaxID=2995588 RepID=UPI002260DD98|nr:GNAT family N-acetyltransferase [Microbacterium sp. STN6]MCX7520746.1 GNAT family N-acetyltransferase [Microbacterium sp. STN6]
MPVTVRDACVADAAALAAVAAATFPLACPPHTTVAAKAQFIATVLSAERFREYIAADDRRVLVAVDGGDMVAGDPADGGEGAAGGEPADGDQHARGAIVAYAIVVVGEPGDADVAGALRIRPTVELSKFYVLPEHHGAEVARLLMREALAAGLERGAAGMWLGVNQLNERAQRFYAKSGFERVGTKRFLVGDRFEDDFVFERAL